MQSEGLGMSLSAMTQLIMWAVRSCNWMHLERMGLQWVNEMVPRWARAVIGDRCVIVTVVFNNCKSDVVGDDVVDIVFEGRQ